ncbi:MAG: hypothetical protein EOR78_35110 [Mesorhizobium sp.]|uniref:hypothetical protein n=1 Tax=Mesorhizobium sp. TaxID=1871066 RepID=UPI000FEA371D|nr:hypothetical protein [Mesorhizobium sp.]RWA97015.1 MAG: hypothetical protein EOQ33_33340 [Mesorhizobium sp.]RWK58165.1 MAG: hypothetical protein EOR49_32655 [Mesorhizobium sp.]RWM41630.1 MAG: hypothetical protein EOR76_34280 [Mesorhizobium sp.]RWM44852.1 MAG: hypothetical protein EOR78_35110 [Mesorhizobium sp.]RWO22705.1 MAG: hypothetical protein EOS10_34630 [Mesorhizobium sp.]
MLGGYPSADGRWGLALTELTRKKPLLGHHAGRSAAVTLDLSLEQPAFGQIRIGKRGACAGCGGAMTWRR